MLKLYVWEKVLCDWTCGMIVALAHDVNEARALILQKYPELRELGDTNKQPIEVTKPEAFIAWGGG